MSPALTPDERTRMRHCLAEKVMGWTYNASAEDQFKPSHRVYRDKNGDMAQYVNDWKPDTDWQQAGMVVEALRKKWRDEKKLYWWEFEDRYHWWNAAIRQVEGEYIVSADGNTLPEAICRAAWAVVKEEMT
jgi:Phage ABA sandwich domain